MKYEINRTKIIERIVNLCKIAEGNDFIRIYIDELSLKDIDQTDILGILTQFEKDNKLKIAKTYFGSQLNIKGPWDLIKEPRHYIEVSNIDVNHFEEEYHKSHQLLENQNISNNQVEFFILYSSDRKILLNGKIELSQPDFNSENDLVFKYLYDRSNVEIPMSQLKEKTGMSKPIDKVLTNLGFVKGLRSAFFDVNKTTIKFKKKVNL